MRGKGDGQMVELISLFLVFVLAKRKEAVRCSGYATCALCPSYCARSNGSVNSTSTS